MTRGRILVAAALALAGVAAIVLTRLPPAPSPLVLTAPASSSPVAWPGAFHVHTNRSDGASSKDDIARAAARAGLRFVVFTDHGDGTAVPEPPRYVDGVLCIDAVEISTERGHYIAVGMMPAPYRLAGEPSDVVEDVRRLGGFGIVAHPDSPKPELAWSDWDLPIDGMEWLNADSSWRDESSLRLAGTFLSYLVRPAASLGALLNRPDAALTRWDALARTRPIVGVAGDDAHGGAARRVEEEGRSRRWGGPSYESSFRTFTVRAVTGADPSGDASRDAALVEDAIRRGRLYTAVDAYARPGQFTFEARRKNGERVSMGESLAGEGTVQFEASADLPADGRLVLLRDGTEIGSATTPVLTSTASEPGAYRVEVRLEGRPGAAPWIVSNPIYVGLRGTSTGGPAPAVAESGAGTARAVTQAGAGATAGVTAVGSWREVATVPFDAWRIEADPRSSGTIGRDDDALMFAWTIAPGPRASQYVALSAPLPTPLTVPSAVELTLRSSRPVRVSVQVRRDSREETRWRRSFYLDAGERTLVVPAASLRPVLPADGPFAGLDGGSLLLVLDLINNSPGDSGVLTVSGARLLAPPD